MPSIKNLYFTYMEIADIMKCKMLLKDCERK